MVSLGCLFDVYKGVRITKADRVAGSIPLITAGMENRGVSCYIAKGNSQLFSDAITIDMFGNSFYINCEFYCDDNIIVLKAKEAMSDSLKNYYAMCISLNKYRYSYGRQFRLNKLDEIKVPSKNEIPKWVYDMELPKYEVINGKLIDEPIPSLDIEKWGSFKVSDLFNIVGGNGIYSSQREDGDIPLVSATLTNNGVEDYIASTNAKLHPSGTFTIVRAGAPGNMFYHTYSYYAKDSVKVLYPKFTVNKYIAFFLCTIIKQNTYRYNYGRVLTNDNLANLDLKLPIIKEGNPDWNFMEKYIKTLKYSKEL